MQKLLFNFSLYKYLKIIKMVSIKKLLTLSIFFFQVEKSFIGQTLFFHFFRIFFF